MKFCRRCGVPWMEEGRVAYRAVCPKCHSDIHCCLNCRYHDPGAANQCRVPDAEPVRDRDRANFCEEFQFVERDAPPAASGKADELRKKWDSLFRG